MLIQHHREIENTAGRNKKFLPDHLVKGPVIGPGQKIRRFDGMEKTRLKDSK
jgi:hypothetical protein